MQGGIGVPAEHPTLRSLGSLYFEPIWIFVRGDVAPGRLTGLAGKRIAVGAAGSGTRAVALPLLAHNGVTGWTADLVEIDGNEAIDALRAEGGAATRFVGAPPSRTIGRLTGIQGVKAISVSRPLAAIPPHT